MCENTSKKEKRRNENKINLIKKVMSMCVAKRCRWTFYFNNARVLEKSLRSNILRFLAKNNFC